MKGFKLTIAIIFTNVAAAQVLPEKDSITAGEILKEAVISSYHINDSLLNAPAAIAILTPAEIQRNNLADITPVLNTIPGVYMQSGNINTNRISIRGIGARTPYGTNKIRAFYGSIPLTSGDSETTIEDIDLEVIDKIEVIKGPLSSVYGAGLGGAIIINPKIAKNFKSRSAISTTHGSYGLIKNTANFGYNTTFSSFNINYHRLYTDGYRENSAYNREGVTLAGELLKKEKSGLNYFGNYTYLKAYIPSSIDKVTFETNPSAAAANWKAAQGHEQYDSYVGGLAYDWQIAGNIKNSTSVFINAKDNYEPRPFDILVQKTIGYGARTQFSGSLNLVKVKPEFIIGAEYFKDGFEGGTHENLYEQNNNQGSVHGEQLTGTEQDRNFINVFAQLRVPLTKKIEVQAGVNYNKTSFNLKNTYPVEALSSQSYNYNAIWSPQLSLLYKPVSLQTLYISVSRGFSLPAIEETLTAQGTINPNIKPENGYNFEAGGKFYFLNKSLYAEFSLYHMQVNDLLVAQRVGEDQYIGINAGKTLHQGIEAAANYHWDISKDLALQPYIALSIGNYRFKEFLNDGSDFSGNDLTGVPGTKINAGITLTTTFGFYISSDYYFVDETPINDANTVYNDLYHLLNAKAGYRFSIIKGLEAHLAAGINNVTNTHYASMVLVNATGFGGSLPRFYYPGQPVNYFANLSLSYTY